MRRLVLLHPMDPRGGKLGGIETHVRLVLARHPAGIRMLIVGLDESGEGIPGRVTSIDVDGRLVEFLPVARADPATINEAARSVLASTTLRFALGLLRHLPAIRRALAKEPAVCEIERFEFAIIPKLLHRPLVLIVHNEGTSADKMDSLLKRYWFIHRFNERLALALADRIFAVNPAIARRIAVMSRAAAARTAVMSVSVDTHLFHPTPFAAEDDAFHVGFAGRLDAFKDPPLMFATLARLAGMLRKQPAGCFRRLAFDYVGASDPGRVPGFDAIAPLTIRHGIRKPHEVAALMRRMHAGIITSFFEGMPCFLLEMLASGRPVAAIRLPQFDPLIIEGRSGATVLRGATEEASATALAEALHGLAMQVADAAIGPDAISQLARPHAADTQMETLFACYEALLARQTP